MVECNKASLKGMDYSIIKSNTSKAKASSEGANHLTTECDLVNVDQVCIEIVLVCQAFVGYCLTSSNMSCILQKFSLTHIV